jgi:Tol biopolymer transport system component
VVFDSFANNLVAGSRSRSGVVYLHDMTTGSTVRISVAMGGAEPDGQSGLSRISADGRWVAFESVADDLVPGRPSRSQVYVWDRTTGATSLVSTDWFGNAGDAGSGDAAISADGRYVAFDSPADNLVPGATVTPGVAEVYVRDRTLGTTVLVSRHTSAIGDDSSSHPSISADGRFVAFESRATNLIASNPLLPAAGDQSSGGAEPHVVSHVYLRDLTTSTTSEVDLSTRGAPAASDSYYAAISSDGHAVAFTSIDRSLVPGASRAQTDVYLRDLTAGTTSRISSAPDTAQAAGPSRSPAVDSDGGVVVFVSEGPVAGPANPDGDLYRRDTRHGRTTRMT